MSESEKEQTRRVMEACARAAHEANRAVCIALGDDSQVHWEDAPEWQKEAAYNGVRPALAGMSPERLHQEWCDAKLNDGWVYGPVKDPANKTHPCLVPYDQLDAGQKAKDHVVGEVVRAVRNALVYGIDEQGRRTMNGPLSNAWFD